MTQISLLLLLLLLLCHDHSFHKMMSFGVIFNNYPSKGSNFLVLYLLNSCLFLNIFLSSGADTLAANQSLSGDQTLVSKGEVFELGFFNPGNNSRYYVGIWYKKLSPLTVVWVANRDRPISDKYSSVFKLENGNLVLLDESKTEFWSTNLKSKDLGFVVAVILDDGNLILKDGSNSSSRMDSIVPLWQSFDHPTNTFLPGSKLSYNKRTNMEQFVTSWKSHEDPATGRFSLKLDPNNSQYVVKWNGTEQYWASGPWDGNTFSGVPEMGLHLFYNYTFVSNENESYFTYSASDPSTISRLVMDVSGQIQQLTWMESIRQWNMFWVRPRQACKVYAICGSFGACNQSSSLLCNCPIGFKHRSENDWNLGDFSGGCVRKTDLECGNFSNGAQGSFGFLAIGWNLGNSSSDQSVDTADYLPVTVANEAGCKSACVNDCSCNAYTYFSNICWIWKGKIVNLIQQLEKDDPAERTVHLKVASSDIPLNSISKSNRRKLAAGTISGIIVSVVLALCCIAFIYYRRVRRGREVRGGSETTLVLHGNESARGVTNPWKLSRTDDKGIDVPFFEFESIIAATNNFSDANKLGEGGFGPVYKGKFPEGVEIAVKRLSAQSGQGVEEFKNEVLLIAKLQHRNLVRLLGYCLKGQEMILLYEYMHNKSLDRFIFDGTLRESLDWTKRFDIILGIARGLLYLHQDSRLRIIHRDLKTSNILLDKDMNPKISDFGLAKIVQGRETEANTKRVVGTYGYMAPEYALDGLFSVKSDVFSFGVVVLEIISGKKNTGFYQSEDAISLLGYAWNLWKEEKPLELMDHVVKSFNSSEVLKCIVVSLLCIQEDPSDRPTMSNVLLMLSSDISLPHPKEPAFVARRGPFSSSSSSNIRGQKHSHNEMTISLQEGR